MKRWAIPLDETDWWLETGQHIWSPNNTLNPHTLTRGSKVTVLAICPECGLEYARTLNKLIYRDGTSCPICSGKPIKELLKGINDLASQEPEIALDWDEEANGIPASETMVSSAKSSHWCCHTCGYRWQNSVTHRVKRGQACPHCSGQGRKQKHIVQSGINDLETNHPEIALDWDEEKNGIPASQAPCGSNEKFFWRCHVCGYEWSTTLTSRVACGSGCAHCLGRVVIPGVDDLPSRFPDIAAEWDTEKNGCSPAGIHPGSRVKRHWKCPECGYEWENSVQNRTRKGQGCPRCAGNVVWPGHTDLATTHPWLVDQWHPTLNGDLKPTDVSYGSEKVVSWVCEHGHVWRSAIKNRAFFNTGCPECKVSQYERQAKDILGEIDLASLGFTVVQQWSDPSCRNQLPLLYDFAILDKHKHPVVLIECQGAQHYEPIELFGGLDAWKKQFNRDCIKRQWCAAHEIPLMEICYIEDAAQRRLNLLGFLATVSVIPTGLYFSLIGGEVA